VTDREFLLMEAIRRLDAVYCQLWGCMCAKNAATNRDGEEVFTAGYRQFASIMERLTGEAWGPVVELKRASPPPWPSPPPPLLR
jgi:hypothetical protein